MQPVSPDDLLRRAADLRACRASLRHGSRSFHAASLLLPHGPREDASALYAFCRLADDVADGQGADGQGERAERNLDGLRHRLDLVYAGRPRDHAIDRALAEVVARHAIPRALPEALFEGFEWDAEGRRYETLSDLQAYAARVAGSVGAMMALLMGVRDEAALARACDLGVAMQLSNIARDVAEDAGCRRLYLPRAWLREAGIDPEAWLANPRPSAALAGVVQRLVEEAGQLYVRAEAGIAALPAACRPAIMAARLLYAEIGREVARRGEAGLASRAAVGRRRKLALLTVAPLRCLRLPAGLENEPLPEVRFLLEAVAAAPLPGAVEAPATGWAWTLTLFERLERMERREAGRALAG